MRGDLEGSQSDGVIFNVCGGDVMSNKIKDLSVNELKDLIKATVRETIEDFIEDNEALNSNDFIKSVEEARNDYKSGNVKSIEELDV